MKTRKTEEFYMDDGRSIKKLTENEPGEETANESYRMFVVEQLKKHDGVMDVKDLDKAFWKNYGRTFNDDDLEDIDNGRTRAENKLDHAKAILTGQGITANRSRQRNKKKTTYVILLDAEITPQEWIEWAAAKKKKGHSFQNRKSPKYTPIRRTPKPR